MKTEWTVSKVIHDPATPYVTLVCVDDVDQPTREMRMRVDADTVTTREL